jgi:hypothetical protein
MHYSGRVVIDDNKRDNIAMVIIKKNGSGLSCKGFDLEKT